MRTNWLIALTVAVLAGSASRADALTIVLDTPNPTFLRPASGDAMYVMDGTITLDPTYLVD
ncbi:hypothetical protein, partial [Phenylobacterium sp.]|uniref:hypothetical protein n=1 Tax=Phenylobacterium sp. TaxID=1871053 RepID=UPI0025E8BB6C